VLDPERLELALEREDVELFRARGVDPERDLLVEPLRDPPLEPERDRLLDPDRVDRERVDEPLELPPWPPLLSSSSLSNFFPTPTAAAVASPTAAPVTTFFGVDMPSSPPLVSRSPIVSLLSAELGQLASLNDSMNLGTISSLSTSGPF
jgi:hypothetical protein